MFDPLIPLMLLSRILSVCGSDCQFELNGLDGMIRSSQVEEENKVKPDQAVDCIWTIQAPVNNRVRHVSVISLGTFDLSNKLYFQTNV